MKYVCGHHERKARELMKLCQMLHMSFVCFDKKNAKVLRSSTAVECENIDILVFAGFLPQ
jgi:hypothetical protein